MLPILSDNCHQKSKDSDACIETPTNVLVSAVVVVWLLSLVGLFVTPWTVVHQAPLIFQARILKWVVIPFSRESSPARD